MRILVLTSIFPNLFEPQRATYNRNQIRILGEMHSVRVIAPIAWSEEFRARRAGKASLPADRQVVLDGMTVDHPRVYHASGLLRDWYGRFYYWSVRNEFRRLCREFKPTIIYTPWIYPDGWAAVKLARLAGLPVVLKALGSDVLLLNQHPGRRAGTVDALKSANGLVAVSRDLAEKAIALGANPDRVRVIYCGVERDLFLPGSKTDARLALGFRGAAAQLLFVGNLVSVKGIDLLLKACAGLKSQGLDFQLNIVGEGPLQESLESLGKTLGISDRIRWRGSIPQIQLPNWYRAADLLVLPSRSEGVPNVLLEASGCNTPWVATSVGGIPEIAHLGINRIVPPDSVENLAAAILTSLATPAPMGMPPRAIEAGVEETSEFLTEIADRFRAPHPSVVTQKH